MAQVTIDFRQYALCPCGWRTPRHGRPSEEYVFHTTTCYVAQVRIRQDGRWKNELANPWRKGLCIDIDAGYHPLSGST